MISVFLPPPPASLFLCLFGLRGITPWLGPRFGDFFFFFFAFAFWVTTPFSHEPSSSLLPSHLTFLIISQSSHLISPLLGLKISVFFSSSFFSSLFPFFFLPPFSRQRHFPFISIGVSPSSQQHSPVSPTRVCSWFPFFFKKETCPRRAKTLFLCVCLVAMEKKKKKMQTPTQAHPSFIFPELQRLVGKQKLPPKQLS